MGGIKSLSPPQNFSGSNNSAVSSLYFIIVSLLCCWEAAEVDLLSYRFTVSPHFCDFVDKLGLGSFVLLILAWGSAVKTILLFFHSCWQWRIKKFSKWFLPPEVSSFSFLVEKASALSNRGEHRTQGISSCTFNVECI